MANNRMWLLCNVCSPKFDTIYSGAEALMKGQLVLAKWYPGGSYFFYGDKNEQLEEFLNLHAHLTDERTNYGEYPFRMEYECPKENDDEPTQAQPSE